MEEVEEEEGEQKEEEEWEVELEEALNTWLLRTGMDKPGLLVIEHDGFWNVMEGRSRRMNVLMTCLIEGKIYHGRTTTSKIKVPTKSVSFKFVVFHSLLAVFHYTENHTKANYCNWKTGKWNAYIPKAFSNIARRLWCFMVVMPMCQYLAETSRKHFYCS